MTRTIDKWLAQYGESHQNPTNKMVHWICVPLIFFSIVGLLWEVSLPVELGFLGGLQLNAAMIALFVIFLYYVMLSFTLALGMLVFSAICLAACYFIDQAAPLWAVSLAIFVLAWIGQFYGHKIEGKKPSFLKDIQFLMIGPAWLMSFIYERLGIKI